MTAHCCVAYSYVTSGQTRRRRSPHVAYELTNHCDSIIVFTLSIYRNHDNFLWGFHCHCIPSVTGYGCVTLVADQLLIIAP